MFAGADCASDLVDRPITEAGCFIRRQIGTIKNAEVREREPDLGPAQIALRVRLAEQRAWSVAIGARHDGNQVFAALDVEIRGLDREAGDGGNGEYQKKWQVLVKKSMRYPIFGY